MAQSKKRPGWHQLGQGERDRIEALVRAGVRQAEIARVLKVSPGTVSREVAGRSLGDGTYDADAAQAKARVARGTAKHLGMAIEGSAGLRAHVIAGLEARRSPDEIAGRMRLDGLPFYASKSAIYRWLRSPYGQRYCRLLCTKRYDPKPQGKVSARTMVPNRVGIEERPLGATNRSRYGHYEVDTIVAPKRAGNTEGVAIGGERKARLLVGAKIPSLAPRHMAGAVQGFRRRVRVRSATADNGIENKGHEAWGTPAFFADPHAPWQKGFVECSIGLLRRWFFPKGTDWATVTEAELQAALSTLNGKHRKVLGYRSAYEVALEHGMILDVDQLKNSRAAVAIRG
jgi:IS30 family transposase